MLVRGLYQHWSRSPKDSEIGKLIKAFLAVQVHPLFFWRFLLTDPSPLQYNNLVDNIRAPGTSFYSPDWTGGPIPALIQSGQIIALDVFNSAIGMADEPPSPQTFVIQR